MPKKPAKPFVKITEEDLDLAEEFFENDKHFNEWLCAVVAYYRGKNYTIKTKIVQKYFNTYKKTMDYIIEAKKTGKEGGNKRVENQKLNKDTLQGSVKGGVQESLQPNNKQVISNNKVESINYLYSLYPTKCPNRKASTGKTSKDKKKIENLLKAKSKEELENIISRYLRENKNEYLKNFGTFLNNLPDYSEPETPVNDKANKPWYMQGH